MKKNALGGVRCKAGLQLDTCPSHGDGSFVSMFYEPERSLAVDTIEHSGMKRPTGYGQCRAGSDVPPAESHYMAISQVPISADSFTHKVTNPAWKNKPTFYMVASADRSINPQQERMMAKRAKAKTVEVHSSHVAYMSHPKETAKLIEEAATSARTNH